MQTLKEFADTYQDTVAHCKYVQETFCELTDTDPDLGPLRRWVRENHYGMGEDSFPWMWYLIAQELPDNPKMLEIGVHRGQIQAVWRTLRPDAYIAGVSPFNGAEMGAERDYLQDVKFLFAQFDLEFPQAQYIGYSDQSWMIDTVTRDLPELDVLYIDGGHSYETTRSDIVNYSPLVKKGGFLVIDDCACLFRHPWGYFMGIDTVARAVDEILPPFAHNPDWQHIGNVVHNRIWKRE